MPIGLPQRVQPRQRYFMNQANDSGSLRSKALFFVLAIASGLIREREEMWGNQKLPRGHVSKQSLTMLCSQILTLILQVSYGSLAALRHANDVDSGADVEIAAHQDLMEDILDMLIDGAVADDHITIIQWTFAFHGRAAVLTMDSVGSYGGPTCIVPDGLAGVRKDESIG